MGMTAKEKQKRYRERKRGVTVTVTVTENGNAEGENVTVGNAKEQNVTATTKQSVTGCQHPPIISVTKANRHLTYTKYSLPVSDLGMPEPKLFTCGCCGKEWLCKRPDIQSAYCLQCERVEVGAAGGLTWREQEPYVRPEYEDRAKAMQALAK